MLDRTLDATGQPFAAEPVKEPAPEPTTLEVEVSEVLGDAKKKELAHDDDAPVPVSETDP